jgi:hypothetical protein
MHLHGQVDLRTNYEWGHDAPSCIVDTSTVWRAVRTPGNAQVTLTFTCEMKSCMPSFS